MTTEYLRIPLVIDARFMTDGTFIPHKLFYNDVKEHDGCAIEKGQG